MSTEQLIFQIAEYEVEIGNLYAIYGALFKQSSQIWTELADQEFRHGGIFLSLRSSASAVHIPDTSSKEVLLANSTKFIRKEKEKALAGKTDEFAALELAMRIESGIFESKILDIFNESPPEIKKRLKPVADETTSHLQKIVKRLEEVKNAPKPSIKIGAPPSAEIEEDDAPPPKKK